MSDLIQVTKNGDIAIIQTPGRTYARRVGIDQSDLSRIALETMPSTNPRAPPLSALSHESMTSPPGWKMPRAVDGAGEAEWGGVRRDGLRTGGESSGARHGDYPHEYAAS